MDKQIEFRFSQQEDTAESAAKQSSKNVYSQPASGPKVVLIATAANDNIGKKLDRIRSLTSHLKK